MDARAVWAADGSGGQDASESVRVAWVEGWEPLLQATENLRVAIEKKNLDTSFSYSDFEVLRPYERVLQASKSNSTQHDNATSDNATTIKVVVRVFFVRVCKNGSGCVSVRM